MKSAKRRSLGVKPKKAVKQPERDDKDLESHWDEHLDHVPPICEGLGIDFDS